ncbi:MAG TPA: hypothetical protein VLL76_09850 [Candidatus Omnitrophota bacterium]|nr:hypothetical protein [Candidatus Omnitrophota bacterium]
MRSLLGVAAFVMGLLVALPAFAEWRFEFRNGPDPRMYRSYRAYDPFGMPFGYMNQPRQRCWVEVRRDIFGYSEVRRCRPARGHGYGRPPGFMWDLD